MERLTAAATPLYYHRDVRTHLHMYRIRRVLRHGEQVLVNPISELTEISPMGVSSEYVRLLVLRILYVLFLHPRHGIAL